MSLTLLGWFVVFSSIAILALLVVPLRSRRLEAAGGRPKLGNLNETEEDAAKEALLSRLRSSHLRFGQDLRGTAGTSIAAAAAFLLVAGIGAIASYVGDSPEATSSGDTIPFSLSGPASNGETIARLTDYARSIGTEEPASGAAGGKLLPDVNTMIERLAARLETTPDDIEGWRMLGWSYFHTERYEQAATAYARAIALDPSSAELKLLYQEAKAKASASDDLETQTGGTR
jgi:cytochrome c-type biogenesis protein CcmH